MPEVQSATETPTYAGVGEAVGAALAALQSRAGAVSESGAAPINSIAAIMERVRARTPRVIPSPVEGVAPIRVRFVAEQVVADATPARADSDSDADSDATPDDFWAQERERIGLMDSHDNAMYLVMTLTHADTVMNNYSRDFIPLDEHLAAAPTIIGQPMDMASAMDCHERERLWGSNGIRAWVYAQRTVGNAFQIGVCLWCLDFPDIAANLLDFQESLGGSYDLLAYDHAYEQDANYDPQQETNPDQTPGNYPVGQTRIRYTPKEGGSTPPQMRVLKKIVYLGGAILTKSRAADSTTDLTDIQYNGKDAEQLRQERNTMGDNATNPAAAGATAAADAGSAPGANPPAAPAPTHETAMVGALASAQRESATLQAEVSRLAGELQVRDQRVALAQTELATERGNRERIEAERDSARADLQTIRDTQASAQRANERLSVLDGLPAAETPPLTVPAFDSDEARSAALAAIMTLDDAAFENYRLQTLAGILRRAATATAAGANAAPPTPAAAAASTAPAPAATAAATHTVADSGPPNFTEFGKEFANALRGGAPAN